MEYRHKLMRGTVGAIVNKAIRDIRNDPKRSIRNLADLGELFSTSSTQRKFFSLARGILRNPCNPYNELLVRMTQNVNSDSLRTLCLNFGYTALNYGAETLRKHEAERNCHIPWILIFDFRGVQDGCLSEAQISASVSDAVSLGIYSFILMVDEPGDVDAVLDLCASQAECIFFIAVPPKIITPSNISKIVQAPNLIVSVDVTRCCGEEAAGHIFDELKAAGRFFGYHAFYNEENMQRLTSEDFTRQMIQSGCLIGTYVNADRNSEELGNRVYSFACAERGRNGEPLFALDFYRDISYVGNSISCGNYLLIRGDGSVPGHPGSLKNGKISDVIYGV